MKLYGYTFDGLHITSHIVAIVALFVACFAITGYIAFRDTSIPDSALENELYLFPTILEDGEILTKNNYLGHNSKFVIDVDHADIGFWQSSIQKYVASTLEQFDYDTFKIELFGTADISNLVQY